MMKRLAGALAIAAISKADAPTSTAPPNETAATKARPEPRRSFPQPRDFSRDRADHRATRSKHGARSARRRARVAENVHRNGG